MLAQDEVLGEGGQRERRPVRDAAKCNRQTRRLLPAYCSSTIAKSHGAIVNVAPFATLFPSSKFEPVPYA